MSSPFGDKKGEILVFTNSGSDLKTHHCFPKADYITNECGKRGDMSHRLFPPFSDLLFIYFFCMLSQSIVQAYYFFLYKPLCQFPRTKKVLQSINGHEWLDESHVQLIEAVELRATEAKGTYHFLFGTCHCVINCCMLLKWKSV